jgi:glucose/arabinose dehydrogenase
MAWTKWKHGNKLRAGCGILLSTAILLAACGGGGDGGSPVGATPAVTTASAAPATLARTLEVQGQLAQSPFDQPRTLTVPAGFGIRLWARVEGARFLALAPNGDVLVSHPGSGRIFLLRERSGQPPQSFEFAQGLRNPHDMVFHQIGNDMYLYVAESNRVTRSIYRNGDTLSGTRETVVDNLPDESTPELGGAYAHQLKNIAISPDHKLYVAIASSCNSCASDADSSPVRGAIYQYNADGSGGRLYARGIRNAEGLDINPDSGALWIVANSRDEIRYPFDNDLDHDGKSDLGGTLQSYVDDNPPDLFTAVRDGGNYGWPFCNPVPNASMTNLDLANDFDNNRDGARLNCAAADRASKGIRAHAAPLGMSFLHASNVPAAYRKGAVSALHGCWDCSSLRFGYKVVYFPFDAAGNPGAEVDLVTGFVTDPDARQVWGRPVDAIADAKGGILISDDYAGAVYQLYPL